MSSVLYNKRKNMLVRYYHQHKRLPTYDEMTSVFGVQSKGSLYKYVEKFIDDELVAKSDTGSLIPTAKLYGLRVLGSVQAGFPSPAEEELVDTMSLDEWLIENPDASYVLNVSGDSMLDAGIIEGDLVIVDRGKTPKSGDIVIAQIDHEWTMKYFINRGGKIFLRAANKKYTDLHPTDELTIGGVVTSVIRKY
jgi:SOS regulatory protein LexA